MNDAVEDVNAILMPSQYITLQGQTVTVYARVTNLLTEEFDVTSFNLLWDFITQAPVMLDVTTCDSYTLNALPVGFAYYTGTDASGDFLVAGDTVEQSLTLYVHSDSPCSTETSFVITIIPSPEISVSDVISCEAYTLPALAPNYEYRATVGGAIVPAGSVITQTTSLYIRATNGACVAEQQFSVVIGGPPAVQPDPLSICNNTGFASFDLSSAADQISSLYPAAVVTFYLSAQDMENGVNPLISPFTNTTAESQLLYVRVGVSGIDCFSTTTLQLYVPSCTETTLSGVVTFDNEADGCDPFDAGLPGVKLSNTFGGTQVFSYTNATGAYQFTNVQAGSNEATIDAGSLPVGVTSVMPGSFSYTAVNGEAYTSNFCAVGTPVTDLSVYLSPMTVVRPGLEAVYQITIMNLGNLTATGAFTFTYDAVKFDLLSTSVDFVSVTDGSVTFDVNALPAYTSSVFTVSLLTAQPPVAESGQVVNAQVVLSVPADLNAENNTASLSQTIVNSYDPNDITVHEGAFITPEQATEKLHYTIRFQNTGNFPATDVRLENTLNSQIDADSFRVVAASHNYQVERLGGELTFLFNIPPAVKQENLILSPFSSRPSLYTKCFL
ncbi:MAG: carboxypeptidase regulatory-like domain-containing protein [Sphingobacteriales bacterium]|nr:MAG: carboxypeptidase regulatory-like domain-containing protein [Sphingobacteriales bacterium]